MIPHFFQKEVIPPITNKDLQKSISYVHEAADQMDALQRAYTIITARFVGQRFQTYLRLHKAFETDPNILWERTGFMHCTQQNYLLRILLIQSGWFSEDDISLGYSFVWNISPHQYLRVVVNGKIIALDPWNSRFGARMGTYAKGFGFAKA